MAKGKFTKLLARISNESEDGVAHPVDVKETSAELAKPELKTSEDDGSDKGQIEEAHQNVDAGGKDYTAIDEASKRQGEVIHKQLERLQETSGSLEAYIEIVEESSKAKTSIGSGAAAVIQHDLVSRYPKFFDKVVPSVEAFDMATGRDTTVALGVALNKKLTQVKANIEKKKDRLATLAK